MPLDQKWRTFGFSILGILLASAIWVSTREHGLRLSPDSVDYLKGAQRFAAVGRLEIPLTSWNDSRQYSPHSHHAPLLTAVLGAGKKLTGVEVSTLAQVLNIALIGSTILMLGLTVKGGVVSFLAAGLVFVTPGFLEVYLWLWSEPLFLFLCFIAINLTLQHLRNPRRYLLLVIGLVCAAATLTRYAGGFLAPALAGAVFIENGWNRESAIRTTILTVPAFLVAGLWILNLSTVDATVRTFGWFPGIWSQLIRELPGTFSYWIFPTFFPSLAGALIVVTGGAFLLLSAKKQRAGDQRMVRVALVLAAVYALAIIVARIFSDPNIPFDYRILSPLWAFLGMAITAACAQDRIQSIRGILVLVAALTVFGAQMLRVPQYFSRGGEGIGYEKKSWNTQPWMAPVRSFDPNASIYSNDPFLLAIQLDRPIKNIPQPNSAGDYRKFLTQLSRTPSLVVLFPHAQISGRNALLSVIAPAAVPCGDVYLIEFVDGLPRNLQDCDG